MVANVGFFLSIGITIIIGACIGLAVVWVSRGRF
jgi:hypothetical protein